MTKAMIDLTFEWWRPNAKWMKYPHGPCVCRMNLYWVLNMK
jgi:hypothetical protein